MNNKSDAELIEYINSKTGFTTDDLLVITTLLRHKCPWDAEQTHESVRTCFIEEVYEACDAIDRGDPENLCEELGDVLFQVLFHAEMAKEEKSFDYSDVINGVCRKLIVRHPHVFGDVSAETSAQVLNNWDKIKAKTKGQSASATVADVPRALPALMRAQKLAKRAAKAGLYEHSKALSGMDPEDAERVLGARLFDLCSAAEAAGINAEEALTDKNDAFLSEIGVK